MITKQDIELSNKINAFRDYDNLKKFFQDEIFRLSRKNPKPQQNDPLNLESQRIVAILGYINDLINLCDLAKTKEIEYGNRYNTTIKPNNE